MRAAIATCLAVGAWACIGNSFIPSKEIAGGYALVHFEGTAYWIEKSGTHIRYGTDADPLYGQVLQIGWNDSSIVYSRADLSGQRGWIIIDLRDGRVEGPLTEQAFSRRRAAEPGIASVVLHPPDEAWKLL